ncbi:lipopolysaccharide biosynthesis protein [Calditrichota bacterium LG25]
MSSFRQKAFFGVLWSAIERFSAQGVQFVLGIIVARLLFPADYGLIGMLAIFLAISEAFIQSGFGAALIQKQNRDELDFSTTFYFNIVVASFFYLVLFFSAPLIAEFYKQPILIPLTRVVGLTLIINSFAVVQQTKYIIALDFKTQTKASLSSILISGAIGIYLAYSGYGVWAIVWQTISRRLINTVVLWFYLKWFPKEGFSYIRFKKLFSFGSKLLISGLFNAFYQNIYVIVIGKLFTVGELGTFTRAKQFNEFPTMNLSTIMGRVTFPLLSSIQDDNNRLLVVYRKLIKYYALIIFPIMMGLAAVAKPMILILLSEKWIDTAWMLQLLAFSGMWYPILRLNLIILNVKGRSDLFLKLDLVSKTVVSIGILASMPFGIKGMIIGQIITTYLTIAINTHYTKKLLGYGFFDEMRDVYNLLFLSFIIGFLIYFTITIFNNNYIKLMIGVLEGVIFFSFIAWIFNLGDIKDLVYIFNIKKRV